VRIITVAGHFVTAGAALGLGLDHEPGPGTVYRRCARVRRAHRRLRHARFSSNLFPPSVSSFPKGESTMWSNFYQSGGYGMHLVSAFGFLLVLASVLYLLRPHPRNVHLVITLGVLTLSAGALGTASGIAASGRYVAQVEPARQLGIYALGIQESVHNLILALTLILIAGLLTAAGIVRARRMISSST
jgi:hypothetical protein